MTWKYILFLAVLIVGIALMRRAREHQAEPPYLLLAALVFLVMLSECR